MLIRLLPQPPTAWQVCAWVRQGWKRETTALQWWWMCADPDTWCSGDNREWWRVWQTYFLLPLKGKPLLSPIWWVSCRNMHPVFPDLLIFQKKYWFISRLVLNLPVLKHWQVIQHFNNSAGKIKYNCGWDVAMGHACETTAEIFEIQAFTWFYQHNCALSGGIPLCK